MRNGMRGRWRDVYVTLCQSLLKTRTCQEKNSFLCVIPVSKEKRLPDFNEHFYNVLLWNMENSMHNDNSFKRII